MFPSRNFTIPKLQTSKFSKTVKNNNNTIKELEFKKNFNNEFLKTQEPEDQIPNHRRTLIFNIFLISNLFLNYDTGVIPASLIQITKEIKLDYSEQALIGSLVYLGLSFSSIFVGLIFSRFSPSKVCSLILLLNCMSCFVFSISSTKNCTIFGVFLGYLAASVIINFFNNSFLTWRFAIQIQGFVEIFLAFFFWFEKDEYINVNTRKKIPLNEIEFDGKDINVRKNSNDSPSFNSPSKICHINSKKHDPRIDTIELDNLGRYCLQTKTVLTNKLYVLITLAMTSIYFIVTGIQFWITKYLIEILNVEPIVVNVIFSIISITAPLSGVLFGGTISDKYGGYKGKNETKALKMCSAFGILAFFFGLPMGFMFQIIYISILLWTFLFFGAAIIPIGTGIMISSVPKDCQATSSSISQLVFNLLGYFSSPMITGFIMDRFEDEKLGFIWGMRVVFFWVIFALFFVGASYYVSYRNFKRNIYGETEGSSMIEDNSMKENLSNFMKLEINRRLAQGSNFL